MTVVAIVLGLVGLVSLWRLVVGVRGRRRADECVHCGYEPGVGVSVCPECGREPRLGSRRARSVVGIGVWLLAFGVSGGGAVLSVVRPMVVLDHVPDGLAVSLLEWAVLSERQHHETLARLLVGAAEGETVPGIGARLLLLDELRPSLVMPTEWVRGEEIRTAFAGPVLGVDSFTYMIEYAGRFLRMGPLHTGLMCYAEAWNDCSVVLPIDGADAEGVGLRLIVTDEPDAPSPRVLASKRLRFPIRWLDSFERGPGRSIDLQLSVSADAAWISCDPVGRDVRWGFRVSVVDGLGRVVGEAGLCDRAWPRRARFEGDAVAIVDALHARGRDALRLAPDPSYAIGGIDEGWVWIDTVGDVFVFDHTGERVAAFDWPAQQPDGGAK